MIVEFMRTKQRKDKLNDQHNQCDQRSSANKHEVNLTNLYSPWPPSSPRKAPTPPPNRHSRTRSFSPPHPLVSSASNTSEPRDTPPTRDCIPYTSMTEHPILSPGDTSSPWPTRRLASSTPAEWNYAHSIMEGWRAIDSHPRRCWEKSPSRSWWWRRIWKPWRRGVFRNVPWPRGGIGLVLLWFWPWFVL